MLTEFGDAFELFQAEVRRTQSPTKNMPLIALGLSGEVGEISNAIVKHLDHGVTEFGKEGVDFLTHIEEELGDALHYLAYMCNYLSLNLATVARKNIEKLELRYPGGFVPGGGIR